MAQVENFDAFCMHGDRILNFTVKVPIFDLAHQIVFFNEALGDQLNWDSHVFVVVHRGGKMDIASICTHVFSTWGDFDRVLHIFGSCEVRLSCGDLSWVGNYVAPHGTLYSVGIFLVGVSAGNSMCVYVTVLSLGMRCIPSWSKTYDGVYTLEIAITLG